MRSQSKKLRSSASKRVSLQASKQDVKTAGKWSLRSARKSDGTRINGKDSPRFIRLKRRSNSKEDANVKSKKPKLNDEKRRGSDRVSSKVRKADRRKLESDLTSSESASSETEEETSPRRRSSRQVSQVNRGKRQTRSSPRIESRNTQSETTSSRSSRRPRERSESVDNDVEGKTRRSNRTLSSHSNSESENATRPSRSSRSLTAKENKCNRDGHGTIESKTGKPLTKKSTSEEDKRDDTSTEDSLAKESYIDSGESTVINGDCEDTISLGEESDVESISSDEDDLEITVPSRSGSAQTVALQRKIEVLESTLSEAKTVFAQAKKVYEKKLKAKDEELERLKNELQWKDEQLDDMNELASRNIELESKINHMLGDKEAYDIEVKRIKEEAENADKDKEKKKKKDEEKKSSDASDSEIKGKKRKRRSRRRKKKEEESEGEDIDALFVSEEEDVEILDKGKETIDITGEESGNESKPSPSKTQQGAKQVIEESAKDKTEEPLQKEENKQEDDKTSEQEDGKKDKHGRHDIRKVMTGKKLQEETVKAAKTEKERRERAKKEHDKHEVVTSKDPKTKLPICTKLVLAFKERKEKDKGKAKVPLVEVNSRLIKKLKPHQWEAVEFMWDNVIESMDKLKLDDPGQGCILAHCMGLGKTLSVITLVHTLLSSEQTEQFTSCLVVCPLNTVLNWQYEWKKWLDKKDRLPIFEMASCKHNAERAKLLHKWQSSGGIMIMGYQLFRILANYPGKSKKNKKAFEECLLDPGPDIVICDEGHVLKNDGSAISKAMNRVRSKRRVVLTGTPLQNNLVEYHCMVNFVKPNLLGTLKEFKNRFANPITNGQHSDSTAMDVKIMKRRAHILHEMLAGCVQRKDYTELTKLLPPKHEYVISVSLSDLQIELYEKYLELNRTEGKMSSGTSLFSDYQALMRIWTHPWVLKLDEERQEKKAFEYQDDELDELDESEEEIVISSDTEEESQASLDDEEVEDESGEDENGDYRPAKKKLKEIAKVGKRNTRSLRKTAADDANETGEESESSSRQSSRQTRSEEKSKESKDSKEQSRTKKKNTTGKSEKSQESTDAGETSSATEDAPDGSRKAKVLAGEVIRKWKSSFRHGGNEALNLDDLCKKEETWWTKYVDEEKHKKMVELSGKLVLLFEIVRMAETLGDKVLVFSQSLLSLDLIELFLSYKDEEAEKTAPKKGQKVNFWKKDEDYLRMDGSTGAQSRSKFTTTFNDPKNSRLRLFLISTRAGGLGINLDSANRVVIFDASWNPSHDIQSIFRVYRFGQEKPVYVYRLLAQGTMEEKIYERQVTKETLSQRVIDEHQIDRHFTFSDLQELYVFKPDKLNDPDAPKRPTPAVPKDVVLAELLTSHKDWIIKYHEHDSLLENRPEENLSEEEREKAWEEYEREKQGLFYYNRYAVNLPQLNNPPQFSNPLPHIITIPKTVGTINTTSSTMPQSNRPIILPRPPPTIIMPAPVNISAEQDVTKPVQDASKTAVQAAQLPRVVQEILKYNPNITTDELQKRLQAFLGMQSKYQPPGQMGRPLISQQSSVTSSLLDTQTNMPSRLPAPGQVPADKKT